MILRFGRFKKKLSGAGRRAAALLLAGAAAFPWGLCAGAAAGRPEYHPHRPAAAGIWI